MDDRRLAAANAAAIVGAYVVEELLDDSDDEDFLWEKVTVDVDEYLLFGDPAFRRHFRLTKDILCQELVEYLVDAGDIVRVRRDFRHKVSMVLWIIANPDTFRSVALRFGVHPGEVHRYYAIIIRALSGMEARYITWPDAAERRQIRARFEEISGFPGVVGSIDGKHFEIPRPVEEPAAYRNRHHSYSILAQTVCDDTLMVRDLYVGEAGSLHDARVFRRSPLCRNILFQPDLFSAGEHIIGDSAYMLTDKVMIPFMNNGHLTELKREYNRALSRMRVRVEHTFGRLTMLWRRNKFPNIRNLDYAVDTICASFVLHNFRLVHGERIDFVDHAGVGEMQLDHLGDPDLVNNVDEDGILLQDDHNDPYVIHGEGAVLLHEAQIRGVQKRWDICNGLRGVFQGVEEADEPDDPDEE